MPDSDPTPKLRVVDDDGSDAPQSVVRLKPQGGPGTPAPAEPSLKVAPMPAPAEAPERLEVEGRENFDGRSIEPGIEAILETPEEQESLEQAWGGEGTRLKGLPYGWFVLISLLVLGAGVWSFRAMRQGEAKVEQAHEGAREKEAEDEHEDAVARRLVDAVEKTVRDYLAADTMSAILPLVRDPERVKPLIEDFWKRKPPVKTKYLRLGLFRPETLDGKPFWVVQAEVGGGQMQSLLLEQIGDDQVKVDWETNVCYQPIPWDRYVKGRPTGAMDFRVWITRDVHFSHEFSDSGKWRCFRLSTRDSDEMLYGYAQAGSEVVRALEAYCDSAPGNVATAILSLRVLEQSASPRGVVIEKMVEPRWVKVGARSAETP
ncbi:hypothetical protein [Haloferula sp. BvORR071]|uniref:hypothetical protein n=1 Tax=Haloferula sp. BvORR071 TaxID=1396141 RepID=UPI00054EAED6|nr:hypothetical protein [Haloferula sp. BvORR071]